MLTNILKNWGKLGKISFLQSQIPPISTQIRNSSYQSSKFLEDIPLPDTKFEISKDSVDWEYVKKALPSEIVPQPQTKESYPSGWKPQQDDLVKDKLFFIARTRNHMIPVYLKISQHGIKRHTLIKNIKGDIWALEKELTPFLQEQSFKPIRLQVNEFVGYIRINGDFVNAIKYWLEQRGY